MATYQQHVQAIADQQEADRKKRQQDLQMRLDAAKQGVPGNGGGNFWDDPIGNVVKGGEAVVGGLWDSATSIPRKVITTISNAVDEKPLLGELNALNDKYHNGEISKSELQKQFDDKTKDVIGIGLKVADGGIVTNTEGDKAVNFVKQFTSAGVDTASVLPVGGGAVAAADAIKAGGSLLSKDVAKNILVNNAKQAGVYGTASTANDFVQNGQIDPATAALNYIAPAALGTGAELGLRGAGQLVKTLRDVHASDPNPQAGSIRIPGGKPEPTPTNPVTPPDNAPVLDANGKPVDSAVPSPTDNLPIHDRINPHRTNPAGLPETLPVDPKAPTSPIVDGQGNAAFVGGKANPQVFGDSSGHINIAKDNYISAVKSGDQDAMDTARQSLLEVPVDNNADVAKKDLITRIDNFADQKPTDTSAVSTDPNAIPTDAGAGGAVPPSQDGTIPPSQDAGGAGAQGAFTSKEDANARFFNRDEQLKKTESVHGTWLQKANQALFDKNAPLQVFDQEHFAKTGQHLAAEDNPHAMRQLVNGAPEAALEGLRGVFNDMGYIKKANLSDELMRYGVAKQVVADRAKDYPPEIVQEMQGTINRIQSELPPEKLTQLEAARRNVVDYHNQQLLRLKDEGVLSPQWYDNIKANNSEYFTGFNFADHVSSNERRFATNSGNDAKAPIHSVRGLDDAGKFNIEDPTTAIPRQAIKLETQLANHKVIDAINRYQDANPDSNIAVRINTPEAIDAKIDLNMQNKGLRPVRDGLKRAIGRDAKTARKLETVINNLNKEGMNLSLRKGGDRMASDALPTVDGFGGDVPTSQAGKDAGVNFTVDNNGVARGNDAKAIERNSQFRQKQTDAANAARPDAAAPGTSSIRPASDFKQANDLQASADRAQARNNDIITKRGTAADQPVNDSKLGTADTARFFKHLIENNSRRQIDQIITKIGTKDAKLTGMLEDLGRVRSEFDDIATQIKANRQEVLNNADKEVPAGYEAIDTWQDGKKIRTAVLQPIADALKGKNDIQVGTIENFFGKTSKPFRASATVFSPGFAPFMGIKDFGQWILTSENLPIAQRALIVPAAYKYAKGLFHASFNTDLAKLATKAGAGGSNTLAQSTESLIKDSAKNFGRAPVSSTRNMFDQAKNILTYLPKQYAKLATNINRSIEYAPKLAEFQAALDKGKSVEGAAVDARGAVADMQNAGVVGRVLNNFVPFANATLQGTGKLVKYGKQNPATFTALAATTVALPAVTAYAWNTTMFPDVWDSIDQNVKDTDFLIILSDHKVNGTYTDVIKIPKTDAAKVIAAPIEAGLQAIRGKDHDSITAMLLKTLGFLTPVSIEKNGQFDPAQALNATPPLLKVPFELATNTDIYTGNQITPDNLRGLNPQDQVKDTTPGSDKIISAATGGAINPLEAGVIRKGFTANLGSTDPGTQLTKRFAGASGGAHQTQFYDLVNTVRDDRNRASNAVDKALAAGDMRAAQNIVQRYNTTFRNTMDPWVKEYGNTANQSMKDAFVGLRLNLTSSSVKSRMKTINKKAADKALKTAGSGN